MVKIKIQEYSPEWKIIYNNEKDKLLKQLSDFSPKIEHIGSTAIPEICSKPIIDIMAGLKYKSFLNKTKNILIENNYYYIKMFEGLIPDRKFFIKLKSRDNLIYPVIENSFEYSKLFLEHRAFHLHIVVFNDEFWQRQILFRDYLIKNRFARLEYKQIKEQLAQKKWNKSYDYANAKSKFIDSIILKAKNELKSVEI